MLLVTGVAIIILSISIWSLQTPSPSPITGMSSSNPLWLWIYKQQDKEEIDHEEEILQIIGLLVEDIELHLEERVLKFQNLLALCTHARRFGWCSWILENWERLPEDIEWETWEGPCGQIIDWKETKVQTEIMEKFGISFSLSE